MKRSVQDTPIVFIGAGNIATNLAKALYRNGFRIVQIYSRTEKSAQLLAQEVEAEFTTNLAALNTHAKLYIVALKDDVFLELLPQITQHSADVCFVHTAGSIPMNVWEGHADRYGVLYPMQTFSKERQVNFQEIPFFIESNNEKDAHLLKSLAGVLSSRVYDATSDQRKSLHLAAVFTCNFTNHMYTLAAELLKKNGLDFEVMLPLIDETACKAHVLAPYYAQTGPAMRYDLNIINKHLEMLRSEPDMQKIYSLITESIHQLHLEQTVEKSIEE